MRELIRITVGLTISCLLAAAVMGGVFIMTAKAKKRNERLHVQESMLGLLGYRTTDPAPSGLMFFDIYRYVLEDGGTQRTGYMIPERHGGQVAYVLLIMDLEGRYHDLVRLPISPEEAKEKDAREAALRAVMGPPKTFSYSDTTVVAKLGDKRLAYLLPGEFPGFKTFIRVILALDPSFQIIGLEIVEHEEDPGLGGEIQQPYFKGQFEGKTYEKVKALEVITGPLPEEYRSYLERHKKGKSGHFSKQAIDGIRKKYQDEDIHAVTGATISSEAVTKGVKNMTRKFAYRMRTLDHVIATQGLSVAF